MSAEKLQALASLSTLSRDASAKKNPGLAALSGLHDRVTQRKQEQLSYSVGSFDNDDDDYFNPVEAIEVIVRVTREDGSQTEDVVFEYDATVN